MVSGELFNGNDVGETRDVENLLNLRFHVAEHQLILA